MSFIRYRNYIIAALAIPAVINATAQGGKTTTIELQPKQYDSLGNHYLFNSDTSMAIYYYQKYVDKMPEDINKAKSLDKLRKLYVKNNQSFYLGEY